MTNSPLGAPTAAVPQWDVCDRLRKALRHGDISVNGMAVYLDVSRNTVGNWINGRVPPSTQALRLWSMRCGVPFEWLRDGIEAPHPENDTSETRRKSPWIYGSGGTLTTCDPLPFSRPVAA